MNKGDVRLICYFYDQPVSSLQMSFSLKDQREHCDNVKEAVSRNFIYHFSYIVGALFAGKNLLQIMLHVPTNVV